MHPRHMCAPGSSGGEGTSALIAQEAPQDINRGRTLGQVMASLTQQDVKGAAPDAPQALIDMCRCGPALNTGKTS